MVGYIRNAPPPLSRAGLAFGVALLWPAVTHGECRLTTLAPGDHTFLLESEGIERLYDVHVPPRYDGLAPVPLVLDFHGYPSSKEDQAAISGLREVADEVGFVVVYPQGHESSWNGGDTCCAAAHDRSLDDVGLAVEIVGQVSGLVNIDHGRVYATGFSNGAALAHRLACEAADVFAAVLPVSFSLDLDPPQRCRPARPVAIRHYHGLDDDLVNYHGSPWAAPARASFTAWARINGCSGAPRSTFDDGAGSFCETFDDCRGGVEVSLCSLRGGHVLYRNAALDIASSGYEFLRRFTLPLPDGDDDGVPDRDDNCPALANPHQRDRDADCIGDVCESGPTRPRRR